VLLDQGQLCVVGVPSHIGDDSGNDRPGEAEPFLPAETLREVEADRKELLQWARSKAEGRVHESLTPWDETGACKYSYGSGDGSRKPKPEPEWVDANDRRLAIHQLEELRAGTPVEIEILQRPYAMGPNVGTSLRVVKVKCLEVSGGGRKPVSC